MRFLLVGMLTGGMLLTLLGWITAMLPPHYRQFKDPHTVAQAIQANVSENGIYAAPQGLFVSVALNDDLSNRLISIGPHLANQFLLELVVALCLSLLLIAIPAQPILRTAALLGLAGLAAGLEVHFPEWNWTGFPPGYVLAGTGYLAANWFIAGLMLGALRGKLT